MPKYKYDENGGRWITTKSGRHVYIQPGETKEQALLREFGDESTKAKRYEPEGGFDSEVRAFKYVGRYDYYHWGEGTPADNNGYYRLDESKSTATYKGETGKYTDMIEKYGRTPAEVLAGTSKNPQDVNERNVLKSAINFGVEVKKYKTLQDMGFQTDNYTYDISSNDLSYGRRTVRQHYVQDKDEKPIYTQTVYNQKGNLVGTLDSTGKQTGNIVHSMLRYDPHPWEYKKTEEEAKVINREKAINDYNEKYQNASNFTKYVDTKKPASKPATKPASKKTNKSASKSTNKSNNTKKKK